MGGSVLPGKLGKKENISIQLCFLLVFGFFFFKYISHLWWAGEIQAWAVPGIIPAGFCLSQNQQDQTGFHLRNIIFLGCVKDRKVQKIGLNALWGRTALQGAGWDVAAINLGSKGKTQFSCSSFCLEKNHHQRPTLFPAPFPSPLSSHFPCATL